MEQSSLRQLVRSEKTFLCWYHYFPTIRDSLWLCGQKNLHPAACECFQPAMLQVAYNKMTSLQCNFRVILTSGLFTGTVFTFIFFVMIQLYVIQTGIFFFFLTENYYCLGKIVFFNSIQAFRRQLSS